MCGRMVGNSLLMLWKNLMAKSPTLTTDSGAPVADNQNSLTAGPRGPVLLQDYQLIEKLAHQNRERIPERAVHAKGWGAYGTLTITDDITQVHQGAGSSPGRQEDRHARCASRPWPARRGAADAERDVRGFALKFYTEEGNWDLVGNNTPVFFVRDPLKFPDFIHTQKRHPKTNLRSPTAMWDFWSLSPESLHQVTILMSDRGLPQTLPPHATASARTPTRFINAHGERFWVKFHFKTMQGIKHWTNAEADASHRQATARATRTTCSTRSSAANSRSGSLQVQIMPETRRRARRRTTRST